MDEFVSTFTNRLDAKGRVSIPAQFRAVLSVDGFEGLYSCPTLDLKAVDAGGNAFRQSIREMLSGFNRFSEEHEALSTTLIGESEVLHVDSDGRVVLTESILAHTGISERVTFVGHGFKFQIWDPVRFAAYREDLQVRSRELRRNLSANRRAAGAGRAE